MGTALSILIVEDSATDAGLMVRELQTDGFDVVHARVESAAQMREALRARAWDVVLSDFSIPGFGAVAALALLRESDIDIPFIVVSGTIGEETAVELMKAGAHDCVTKVHLTRLGAVVRRAMAEADERLRRTQAEMALRANVERFQLASRATFDAIWDWDLQTNAIWRNENFQRFFGYRAGEFEPSSASWTIRIHPDDRARVVEGVRAATDSGRPFWSDAYRFRRKDDSYAEVVDRGIITRDVSGRPIRMIGAMQDVTERKRQQQSLEEGDWRFRGLVEQSLAGIYLIQDGVFLYANPKLEQLLGYGPGEMIGVRVDSIVVAEDLPILLAAQEVLHAGAPSSTYEVRARRRDGTIIVVGAQGTIFVSEGKPAIVGMAQDITEKRRTEKDVQHFTAQLQSAFMQTVEVAMNLSEMRDPDTAGHERRAAEIAVAIGAELGFDANRQQGLRVAGYLHDIGNITVPSEFLAKPGGHTEIEFEFIKGHPQAGYDLLKDVEFPWPVAEVAWQHHERVDGSGYPQGLKGEEILLEARIMAVADVIEAMSSHRPHRAAHGVERVLAEIERGRGTVYDRAVADATLRLFREKGYVIPTQLWPRSGNIAPT